MWKIIGLILLAALMLLMIAGIGLRLYLSRRPDRGRLEKRIDAKIEKWLRAATPATAVIVVIKDGKTWVKSYGPVAATADTLFQIGSVTKVFTALLVHRLCDAEELRMDQTLGERIGSTYPLAPRAATITLRELATHSSGLPGIAKSIADALNNLVGEAGVMVDPYSHFDRDTMLAYLANPQDLSPPGRFLYSNYDMGLAGHVLELRTGKSYEGLLKEHIFTPARDAR